MGNYRKKFVAVNDRKEHERQPGEPDRAWKGFTIYRDIGFTRTLLKAAIEYRKIVGVTESKEKSTHRNFQNWSIRWGWVRRCESWDREVDKQRRRIALEEVKRMRDRHVQLSMSMQQVGATELNKLLKDVKAKAEEGLLGATDIRYLIETGMKLERMSRGEPDSITEERKEISGDAAREELRALFEDKESRDNLRELAKKLVEKE